MTARIEDIHKKRVHKEVSLVILEEPVSPYDKGDHYFHRWQRHHNPGQKAAKWYPEDDNGQVYPYKGFEVIARVNSEHILEKKYREIKGGLRWDLDALQNGDGPSTAVAYGPDDNELFYVREKGGHWIAMITQDSWASLSGEQVPGTYSSLQKAQRICEHLHHLADINHNTKP